jgi:hypothetical protein
VFGNEVGERLKNCRKARSTLRLRAVGHGPHLGPNGRFLPCCGEAARWEQELAEMQKNCSKGHKKDHKLIKSLVSVRPETP